MNVSRNNSTISSSATFRRIIERFDLNNRRVLDLGCANGEFLALFGENSVGITSTQEEVEYGQKQGLDIRHGNVEEINKMHFSNPFDAIWANNLFEHLLSPHAFLMNLKQIAQKDTILILGVPVVPKIELLMQLRKFRGSLASNHINFFTSRTLRLTVEKAGWDVVTVQSFVFPTMLDKLTVNYSPHVYVVARNNSTFSYPPKKVKEWESVEYYSDLLKLGTKY